MNFTVIGDPAQKGSYTPINFTRKNPAPGQKKHGTFLKDQDPSLKIWQGILGYAARKVAPDTPMEGPVELTAKFFLPRHGDESEYPTHRQHGDLDKKYRALGDTLEGIAIKNDSQIVRATVEKSFESAQHPAGAEIEIREYEKEFI